MKRVALLMSAGVLLIAMSAASAEDVPQVQHRQGDSASQERLCTVEIQGPGTVEGFESVQVETFDITRYEQFFESVLHAPVVQSLDHPQVDPLRGYCYRGVLIVVRQDLRTARPTGWVQINFAVPDVAAMQADVGLIPSIHTLATGRGRRTKIVHSRLKPEVSRGHRKAIRFEVTGPEGFMIGFDQYK
ncbi:MAG: hypothetical protein HOP22_12675 [Nitrospiraceae bacterium]|nr:hypothetical protein [Nitrospiraceae bacterium]